MHVHDINMNMNMVNKVFVGRFPPSQTHTLQHKRVFEQQLLSAVLCLLGTTNSGRMCHRLAGSQHRLIRAPTTATMSPNQGP